MWQAVIPLLLNVLLILPKRYQHNTRVLNNSLSGNCNGDLWKSELEKETFAVRLQQAGYVTFYAGKYLNEYGANKVSEELIQIKYFQIYF